MRLKIVAHPHPCASRCLPPVSLSAYVCSTVLLSFKTVFHVAWHVPNIISCVPVSLGALETVQRLLGDDDAARFGTFDTVKDYALLEACVWFGTYLALDTVLATVHKMADVELAVHHLIFASVCYIMFSSGTAPLVGAALIVQELSTPFLNSFLLLRGFCGLGSLWTQLAFGCFALTFYATRVGLNTAVTSLFLRELYRGFVGGTTHLMYSRVEQMLLAAALVGGWCLQVYWGITITKKLIGAIRGEASEKPKAA